MNLKNKTNRFRSLQRSLGDQLSLCLQNKMFLRTIYPVSASSSLCVAGAQGGRSKGSPFAEGKWREESAENTAWAEDPTRGPKEPKAEGKDGKPRARRGSRKRLGERQADGSESGNRGQ